jgi:hypothetical protein
MLVLGIISVRLGLASTRAQQTQLSLFLLDTDPQSLVASVVGVESFTTMYEVTGTDHYGPQAGSLSPPHWVEITFHPLSG